METPWSGIGRFGLLANYGLSDSSCSTTVLSTDLATRCFSVWRRIRRPRACACLADDDHGPLALQEILLAGGPAVGVRTGASFARDGATGYIVERPPPGRECVANDDDEACLRLYFDAIHRAESFDRKAVRSNAAADFATSSILSGLIAAHRRKANAGAPAFVSSCPISPSLLRTMAARCMSSALSPQPRPATKTRNQTHPRGWCFACAGSIGTNGRK